MFKLPCCINMYSVYTCIPRIHGTIGYSYNTTGKSRVHFHFTLMIIPITKLVLGKTKCYRGTPQVVALCLRRLQQAQPQFQHHGDGLVAASAPFSPRKSNVPSTKKEAKPKKCSTESPKQSAHLKSFST